METARQAGARLQLLALPFPLFFTPRLPHFIVPDAFEASIA
jgi:hypothetical protein